MTKLSRDEVQQFLSEREHLARIGTVDSDGMPRVLPLWFIIQGDELLFTPRSLAIIWKNIERDPRVGISIDEETMPMRKVSIQGHVVIKYQPGSDEAWREVYRNIAKRYVSDDFANGYVDGTDDQPRALCAVSLTAPTTKIVTWRMPVSGEDPRGVWPNAISYPAPNGQTHNNNSECADSIRGICIDSKTSQPCWSTCGVTNSTDYEIDTLKAT